MSDYTLNFIPFFRQGWLNKIEFDPVTLRAKVTVKGKATGGASSEDFQTEVLFRGPGDVIGIDHQQIARVYPAPLKETIVSGHFPFIEFKDPNFPWLYSPEAENGRKLKPWLALIVLRKKDFELQPFTIKIQTLPGTPDKVITALKLIAYNGTKNTLKLPNIKDLSLWAHAQYGELNDFNNISEYTCSRLICPIHLEKGENYTAFVVPAYETGLWAGLGKKFETIEVKEKDGKKITTHTLHEDIKSALDYWMAPEGEVFELPVYYHWDFQTSTLPEFEEMIQVLKESSVQPSVKLVNALKPGNIINWDTRKIPAIPLETALMPLEYSRDKKVVNALGYFSRKIKKLLKGNLYSILLPSGSGAITFTDYAKKSDVYTKYKNTHRKPFKKVLYFLGWLGLYLYKGIIFQYKKLENHFTEDPLISIPYYGKTYIRKYRTVLNNNYWPANINLDPCNRIAASVGTKLIQKHQDKFMYECLQQASAYQEAKRSANQTLAAGIIAKKLQEKHLNNLPPERLLLTTQPCHHLIFQDNKRIRSRLRSIKPEEGWVAFQARQVVYKKTRFRMNDQLLQEGFVYTRTSAMSVTRGSEKDRKHDAEAARGLTEEQKQAIIDFLGKMLKKLLKKIYEEGVKQLEKEQNHPFEILEPLTWHPSITIPMYKELLDHSMDYLLPQLKDVENNSVIFLRENRKFIESFMVGANHEMIREMIWREFPVAAHATIFQYFWDAYDTIPHKIHALRFQNEILLKLPDENLRKFMESVYQIMGDFYHLKIPVSDSEKTEVAKILTQVAFQYPEPYIKKINEWVESAHDAKVPDKMVLSPLGSNSPYPVYGDDRLVVGIKGDLIRQIPYPYMFVINCDNCDKELLDSKLDILFSENATPENGIYTPEFQASVGNDFVLVGFPVSAYNVTNNSKDYFFVISELPSLPKFGLDTPPNGQMQNPVSIDELDWSHVIKDDASRWISQFKNDITITEHGTISKDTITSATVAKITLQQPSRIVFSFKKMLKV